ncbi:MAG TPA: IPT/TIG domain-containing protein [Kofleriaceae bacterium]|nr:IPT/TIG domain-containing protein [Kofleriaceae bacterium]
MRAGTYLRFAAATAALGLAACDGAGGGGDINVDSIEPAQGPLGGGQTVIIEGSGFLAGGSAPDLALFGGVLTTQVSALSDTQLQVVTPHNAAPGEVDVLVFNTNGYNLAEGAYTYVDPPTIIEVDADSGHYKGGDEVTVIGTGFQDFEAGQPTLTFDGVPATNVRVQSDTEILAIVPPGTPLRRATAALSNNRGDAAKPEAYLYTAVGFLAITGRGQNVPPPHGTYFVDAETGESFFLSTVDRDAAQIQGMATSPDGKVYGIATHVLNGQTTNRSLYEITPATGVLAAVGTLVEGAGKGANENFRITDVEFHDGALYGVNRFDASLGTIDPDTGEYTKVSDVGIPAYGCCGGYGLASDGDTLYYMHINELQEIDLSTGIPGEPTTVSGVPSSLNGLIYHDDALYAVTHVFLGGGGNLRGAGVVTRVVRIDLSEEILAVEQFTTIPSAIHALAIAPEFLPGGEP